MKQICILLCLTMALFGCKKDDCIHQKKEIRYLLDTVNYSKIPYKDFDTIVLKLESTNDTLSFFADRWITSTDAYFVNPCESSIFKQSRSLTFTCRGNKHESFNGMRLVVSHYIHYKTNQEVIGINFRWGYYVFPIQRIGNNYQVDSVTIQNKTYYDVNFIPDQNNVPFPFGCLFSVKYGILKMHFIDWDWPVPQGGEPWELMR